MGRKKKPSTRTVTFNLLSSLDQRYLFDRHVAELDGRKLSRAEWLNGCVSDALAARSEAMADQSAVSVAFADLVGTLSTNKFEDNE